MKNRLIIQAREGRPPRAWRALVFLVVAVALAIVIPAAMVALLFVSLNEAFNLGLSFQTMLVGISLASEVTLVVVTLGWVTLVERRPWYSIGLRTTASLREWLRGAGVGSGLLAVVILTPLTLGFYQATLYRLDMWTLAWTVAMLGFFIVQGAAEEIVFRGYLMPTLSARWGVAVGVGVTSMVFGLIHSLNPNIGLLPLLNIMLVGVFFALYALVEEGLWGVCGAHFAWNWAQGHVFGLAVSGQTFGASLTYLEAVGPTWITGGDFGPEGGLAATIVLMLACVWLGWRLVSRNRSGGPSLQ